MQTLETNFLLLQLKELPEVYQEAIHMIYFEDLTQEQSAKKIGITQPAFNKRLKKALKILKEKL